MGICAIRTIGAGQRANGLSSLDKVYCALRYLVCYKTCHTFGFYVHHSQNDDQVKKRLLITNKYSIFQLCIITTVLLAVKWKRFWRTSWLPKQNNIYTIKHTCFILVNFGQTEEKPWKHWNNFEYKVFWSPSSTLIFQQNKRKVD